MNRYKVNAMVGEGSFGHVYKAVRKDDNQIVAIKVISKVSIRLRFVDIVYWIFELRKAISNYSAVVPVEI